jgi:HEAT repeat protein
LDEPTAEGKSVSYWISSLQASDMSSGLHASQVLARMGTKAVPYLVRALREDRTNARGAMLTTRGAMGPAAEEAIPDISALLRDESPVIRVTAAATLVSLDCERRVEAWPALLEGLEGEAFAATMAASTIGYMGSDGAPAVPGLLRLVNSADREVRLRAMAALGSIGPSAQSARPVLDEAAREPGIVGSAARAAIQRISSKGMAVPSCSERRLQQKP